MAARTDPTMPGHADTGPNERRHGVALARVCKEPTCAKAFTAHRVDKEFCGPACRARWNNRRVDRGGNIYDAAMRFRAKRNPADFSRLCAVIDDYLRADRDAGVTTYNARPPETLK